MSTELLPDAEREILLKQFPNGVIAFDLETTGLSPLVDEIIEVSAYKVTQTGIATYDQLINPQIEIPQVTIDIHGITNDMVATAPYLDNMLPSIMEFFGNYPLIAHNARFDVGFIVSALHRLGSEYPKCHIFDSCRFARVAIPDSPNHKLVTLAKHLDITHEKAHRALDDAIACLRVFAQGLIKIKDSSHRKSEAMRQAHLFNMKDFDKNKNMDLPPHLNGLLEKIRGKEVIEIMYAGGSHKGKFRPIKPVGILPMPEGNVLYAHCLIQDLYKTFILSKIKDFRSVPANKYPMA